MIEAQVDHQKLLLGDRVLEAGSRIYGFDSRFRGFGLKDLDLVLQGFGIMASCGFAANLGQGLRRAPSDHFVGGCYY